MNIIKCELIKQTLLALAKWVVRQQANMRHDLAPRDRQTGLMDRQMEGRIWADWHMRICNWQCGNLHNAGKRNKGGKQHVRLIESVCDASTRIARLHTARILHTYITRIYVLYIYVLYAYGYMIKVAQIKLCLKCKLHFQQSHQFAGASLIRRVADLQIAH